MLLVVVVVVVVTVVTVVHFLLEEEVAVVDGAEEDVGEVVGEVVEEGGEDVAVNEAEPSKIDNPVYAEEAEEDETQVAEADEYIN